MVCIINGSTASSAELFALSLREFGKAQLIGAKTMGKGTIQAAPQKLSDGSAVVITVAKLLTGQLTSFDGTGIQPDIEVLLTADEEQTYYDLTLDRDPQVQRAIELANSLTLAPSGGQPASSGASSQPAGSEPASSEPANSEPEPASSQPEEGGDDEGEDGEEG